MADRRTGKRKGSSADGQIQKTRLMKRAHGANRMQQNGSLFPAPQHGDIDSFRLAIAAGIGLYKASYQIFAKSEGL